MTPKERILNNITGKPADRVPWSPFLCYYWESLPKDIQEKGHLPYLQAMGADPMIRGPYILWDYESDTCTSRESIRGNIKTVTFETPVGSLTEEYTYSEGGDTWFLTGHPVETEEDFKVLQYIYEHMTLKENLAGFEQDYKDMGEQGLIVPLVGTNRKTSFQGLVEHWVGTVNLSYALMDFPEVVEECLAVMRQRDLESVRIAAKSSAEAFIFWEDSSTTNISPDMFEKYTLPVIREWGDVLHENGKLLIHHACGHLRHFLPLIAKSGIDALESISPPPTGNVEPWEIREALPPEIALIGGIEPTKLLNHPLGQLQEEVTYLLERMKGSRYVLANSDSCPPGVDYEKFTMISELVRNV